MAHKGPGAAREGRKQDRGDPRKAAKGGIVISHLRQAQDKLRKRNLS
jgi:hypothetical protein